MDFNRMTRQQATQRVMLRHRSSGDHRVIRADPKPVSLAKLREPNGAPQRTLERHVLAAVSIMLFGKPVKRDHEPETPRLGETLDKPRDPIRKGAVRADVNHRRTRRRQNPLGDLAKISPQEGLPPAEPNDVQSAQLLEHLADS
jgi:hypothetical protein